MEILFDIFVWWLTGVIFVGLYKVSLLAFEATEGAKQERYDEDNR